MDRSTIPQFTGAAYQSWAYKVQFGLIEKEVHSVVFNFRGRARTPCPVVIEPLSHQALLTLDEDAIDQQKAEVKTREDEIDAWMTMDLKAQSFIVKYLGASEHTHTRSCQFAYEMWDSLKSFYELQGEIEVSNATAKLSVDAI